MIKILDQNTIDKIAAGEVIERPSSVVKELVENSIDAGASSVTIEIKDGGVSFIRVTDNGSGIEKDDVKTAYLRHATSKLESAEDLLGVMTLGFRGEALSTIAAVSQTEMITKTQDSLTGVKYVIHGGREIEYKEIGAPDGTTIIVKNIFYNTPARLKFLKSNMTEGSYINDLVSRIALSRPDISFRLISNGKTIVDTSGNGKTREVIYSLYGRDITRNLLEVHSAAGNIEITGYIGKPFISKGNRSFENYFINNRYIKCNIINRAIEEGYKTYVMQHRFPFTVLYFKLPGELVDVNVHPTKMEFRYHNEQELFAAVRQTVAESLSRKELIPDAEIAGKRNLEEPVKPAEQKKFQAPAEIPKNQEIEPEYKNKSVNTYSKSKPADSIKPAGNPIPKAASGSSYLILEQLLPESVRAGFRETANYTVKQEPDNRTEATAEEAKITENKPEYQQESFLKEKFLSENAAAEHRIIGQIFDTYWLIEYGAELYIMDQHAAHEKVNYEHFLRDFKNKKVLSQQLFPPEVVSVTGSEKLLIQEHMELFHNTGFELEDFGGNEFKLNAVPMNLYGLNGRDIFLEFVAALSDGISGVTEDIFVRKLSTMACKAAIKGNQSVSRREIEYLLEELMTLDNPYTCPHGRPTIIRMSKTELEKKFKRIV